MAIPSRQIGWSTKSNLLWEISKQLEYLNGILGRNIPATTTTTSSSTSSSTSTTTSTTSSTSTTTTTSTSTSTTSTTTTQGPLFFYPRFSTLATLSYRDYDVDPNVYYAYASSSGFRYYYSGTLEVGTQFYYDAAFTDPVVGGNYEAVGAANIPMTNSINTNEVFYTVVNGIVTQVLGTLTISSAWNQFGNNPSLPSRVWNGSLVPCNDMNLSGFTLYPGVTAIGVGVTVYNGAGQLFSFIDYIAYDGIVNVINGGYIVLSQESCSGITTTTTTTTTPAP